MIESTLISNAEFFISPTVFSNWGDKKTKIIEEDYYFSIHERKNHLEEYDLSIFDDIRTSLCKTLSEEVRNHEIKKIDYLPNRPSIEERHHKMAWASIKERHQKLEFTGNLSGKCLPTGNVKFT